MGWTAPSGVVLSLVAKAASVTEMIPPISTPLIRLHTRANTTAQPITRAARTPIHRDSSLANHQNSRRNPREIRMISANTTAETIGSRISVHSVSGSAPMRWRSLYCITTP